MSDADAILEEINRPRAEKLPAGLAQGNALATACEAIKWVTNARPSDPITLESLEAMAKRFRIARAFSRGGVIECPGIPVETAFPRPDPESDEMRLLRLTFLDGGFPVPAHLGILCPGLYGDGRATIPVNEFLESLGKVPSVSFKERRRRRLMTGGLSHDQSSVDARGSRRGGGRVCGKGRRGKGRS